MKNIFVILFAVTGIYLLFLFLYTPNLTNDKSFSFVSSSNRKWTLKNASFVTPTNDLHYATIGRITQIINYPLIPGNEFKVSFDARSVSNGFLYFYADNYCYHKLMITNNFWKRYEFLFSPLTYSVAYNFYFQTGEKEKCDIKEISFKRVSPIQSFIHKDKKKFSINSLINNGSFDLGTNFWTFYNKERCSLIKFKGISCLSILPSNKKSVYAEQNISLVKDTNYDLEALVCASDVKTLRSAQLNLVCFNSDSTVYTNVLLGFSLKPTENQWNVLNAQFKAPFNMDAKFIISVPDISSFSQIMCSGIKVY